MFSHASLMKQWCTLLLLLPLPLPPSGQSRAKWSPAIVEWLSYVVSLISESFKVWKDLTRDTQTSRRPPQLKQSIGPPMAIQGLESKRTSHLQIWGTKQLRLHPAIPAIPVIHASHADKLLIVERQGDGTGTKLGFEPTLTGSKEARIRALDVILSSKKLTVPIQWERIQIAYLLQNLLMCFQPFPISNQWWFGLSQWCRFCFAAASVRVATI